MEGKSDTPMHPIARVTRIAWLITFVVPLVLAVLLLGVKSAQALPPVTVSASTELEDEYEPEEDFELEEGECEEAEEELEEGEISEAQVEEVCDEAEGNNGKGAGNSNSVAPEECLLRSAHARAVADPERNKLKLTVGYTTYEPVGATVEIREGSDRIGSIHRHLGRSGVLRIVESLGKNQAAKRIVVRIRVPVSPRYCGKFQTQEIPVSRPAR